MIDAYGEEIKVGSLLVVKETHGPNPNRVWLGVVNVDKDGRLEFQSCNMRVRIHSDDAEHWQVVFTPKTCKLITGTP